MSIQTAPKSNWVPEWTFGDRIRKVRSELGMDQRELADKLELKHSTLSSYESGRANPRATKLPEIAARMELISGVPKAWFLGWVTENPHHDGGDDDPNVRLSDYKPVTSLSGYRAQVATRRAS